MPTNKKNDLEKEFISKFCKSTEDKSFPVTIFKENSNALLQGVVSFISQQIQKVRDEDLEEAKRIVGERFYKLEEIEKDFEINQEIIKTRNAIYQGLEQLKSSK